jgi:hypothetical protein
MIVMLSYCIAMCLYFRGSRHHRRRTGSRDCGRGLPVRAQHCDAAHDPRAPQIPLALSAIFSHRHPRLRDLSGQGTLRSLNANP